MPEEGQQAVVMLRARSGQSALKLTIRSGPGPIINIPCPTVPSLLIRTWYHYLCSPADLSDPPSPIRPSRAVRSNRIRGLRVTGVRYSFGEVRCLKHRTIA